MTTTSPFASPFARAFPPAGDPSAAGHDSGAGPGVDQEPGHGANRPTRVDWAPVPKVDLLPPEISQARRFRRVQRLLAAGVGATLVLAAAATALAEREVSLADDDLRTVSARTGQLRAEAQKYNDVPRVLAQVDAAKAARETALGRDVLWYRFLNDLAVATPDDVDLSTMTVTLVDASGPAAAGVDPLTPGGLGDITFSGTAKKFPAVASWLTSVGSVHGMDASRLQTASRQDVMDAKGAGSSTVSFSTKVIITADALSHRYDRKAD